MKSAAYILQFVSHNNLDVNDGDLSNLTDGQEIYSLENSSRRYKGKSSGEAPLQYLIDKAWRSMSDTSPEDRKITILPIVSFALYSGTSGNSGRRLYEIFLENIQLYLRNLDIPSDAVETKPVFYDFNAETLQKFDSPYSSTDSITSGIFKYIVCSDPEARKSVLVDYTGGLRDTSYLITLISQYLSFFEIPLTKIVYSNYNNKTIYSITYLNRISELIRCINSLNQSGNPEQLLNFFLNSKIVQDASCSIEQDEYQKVLLALRDIEGFFSCICINNMTNIDNHKMKLEGSMQKIRELDSSGNIYISLFCKLFESIRSQFFLDGSDTIGYESLIKWCVTHNQINQAVTLFIEKMPGKYLESPFISGFVDYEADIPEHSVDQTPQRFYTIYDNLIVLHNRKCPVDQLTPESTVDLFTDLLKQAIDHTEAKTGTNRGNRILKDLAGIVSDKYGDSKILSQAVEKLSAILSENFDESGKNIISRPSKKRLAQKKSEGYLNFLLVNRNILGRIIFEESFTYGKKEETYSKKVKGLEILLKYDHLVSDESRRYQFAEILRFYLLVKIIRNRINHAVDYENPTDEAREKETVENAVIEKCTGGFGVLPKLEFSGFDLQEIKTILRQAVSLPIPQ